MGTIRDIHPDFINFLKYKEEKIIDTFIDLRTSILSIYPESVELLYHTHALTAAFSLSEKLSDAFCMIPIYTNHMNLGFNKGTLIQDPNKLLKGTGKLIRHIPIKNKSDYSNDLVRNLIKSAIKFAIEDMETKGSKTGITISKIKTK